MYAEGRGVLTPTKHRQIGLECAIRGLKVRETVIKTDLMTKQQCIELAMDQQTRRWYKEQKAHRFALKVPKKPW